MKVVKLAKSGGVVVRDEETRHRLRSACIRSYLYGGLSEELSPHSFDVPFDVLRVWKIGGTKLMQSVTHFPSTSPLTHTRSAA